MEEEGPTTGLVMTGELLGEKPENMIPLPIIKKEEHQVSGWMDGWMGFLDGRTDGRMDGRMDGWLDGWMDLWMDG